MDLDRLVKTYRKIRDARTDLGNKFKAEDENLKAKLKIIEDQLLDYCNDNQLTSGRTEHGTFYRTPRTKYWTADWDSFRKFVKENDAFDLLEKRIQQTNMTTWLKENPGKVPMGLNADTEYSINVRKPPRKNDE